jgi:KTSC domain
MPSTVIRSFSYDAASHALTVIFQSGDTFQAMQAAISKGEFFNAHVRSDFRFIRNSARAT